MREQTRLGSLVEACVNVAIGYGVAVAAQLAVFPLFRIHVSLAANLALGAIFTAVSIARSYLVRRLFNRIQRSHGSRSETETHASETGDRQPRQAAA